MRVVQYFWTGLFLVVSQDFLLQPLLLF
jgi:hypothetical protein